MRDLLLDLIEYLDNYVDAEYIEGRPVGNEAMILQGRCEEALNELEEKCSQ